MKLCDYGCGKKAKYYFKIVKKWCCSRHQNSCCEVRKNGKIGFPKGKKNLKMSNLMKGKTPWNKGIKGYTIHSEEFKENLRQEMKNTRSAKMNTTEHIENIRNRMLNGGAIKALSGNRNPSKPQVKLFNIIKTIFSTAILNYPITELNRSVDIGIPKLKIAFEYDESHWHQDTKKDNERQTKIEKLGWNFIRYKNYVPSKNQIIKDLNNFLFLEEK